MPASDEKLFKLPQALRDRRFDKPTPINRRKRTSKLPLFLPNSPVRSEYGLESTVYFAMTCKTLARIAEVRKTPNPSTVHEDKRVGPCYGSHPWYDSTLLAKFDRGLVRRNRACQCQLSCRYVEAGRIESMPEELILKSQIYFSRSQYMRSKKKICGRCRNAVEKIVDFLGRLWRDCGQVGWRKWTLASTPFVGYANLSQEGSLLNVRLEAVNIEGDVEFEERFTLSQWAFWEIMRAMRGSDPFKMVWE
ncbi:MAG: hypothetical protein Q9227_003829 [Pyrenula ochraceoflavens]